MSFVPCRGCRRHVKERTCPFCGASVAQGRALRVLGQLSRAAVFASASACWTSSTPATDTTVHNHVDATTATVSGKVIDSITKEPMAGVRIEIYPGEGKPSISTTTDASGRYHVSDLPPGDYQIVFTGQRPTGSYPSTITLTAGQRMTLDTAIERFDPSNIPMPYGAPPARRRVV